jgi:beta-glucosidase
MTKEEKISMLYGDSAPPYTGHTRGVPRLSIPDLNMNDGPQGFRYDDANDTSTAFPSAMKVAASWDPKMAQLYGETMGKEFHDKGSNVHLGPGMNV